NGFQFLQHGGDHGRTPKGPSRLRRQGSHLSLKVRRPRLPVDVHVDPRAEHRIVDPVLLPAEFRQDAAHFFVPDQQIVRPFDPNRKMGHVDEGAGDPDRRHQRQLGSAGAPSASADDEAQPDAPTRRRMPAPAQPSPPARPRVGDGRRPPGGSLPGPPVSDLLRGIDGLQGAKGAPERAGGKMTGDFLLQYAVRPENQSVSASLAGLDLIPLPPQFLDVLPDGGPAEAELPADLFPGYITVPFFNHHHRQDLLSRPSQSEHLPLSTVDDRWAAFPG